MNVKYLEELDKLELYSSDYVIVGSGALIAHGLEVKNNDLDIIVRPDKLIELIVSGKLKQKIKQVNLRSKIVYVNDNETIEACNLVLNAIDMYTPLSYYFSSNLFIEGYTYLPKVPLRHFYQCLYNTYGTEKFKKRLELLK